jgi:hypothetical protein
VETEAAILGGTKINCHKQWIEPHKKREDLEKTLKRNGSFSLRENKNSLMEIDYM